MTNFKDSVFAKVATGVVAFSAGVFMLGGAAIAPAYAQSNEDLQAQIQSLLETIASLQAQVDGDSSAGMSGTCPSSIFSLSAGFGAEGQAVQDLQVFLNMDADTMVSTDGPGSPGNETIYYGSLTADAVSDFQAKYSANVLAPLGLSAPTGYWGNSSASYAQTLCASWAADDSDDDADDSDDDADDSDDSDDDSDSDDDADLDGGEASLEDFDFNSGDDNDIMEGGSGEVAMFDLDVENADARVARVDLSFTAASGNNELEPWDAFEEIALYHDGEEVASADVDDEDDWLSEDSPYQWRFSNLDVVVREGDNVEFTVVVETQDNVVGSNSDSWTVYVHGDNNSGGVRALDGAGVNSYIGDDNDTVTFDIDPEGENDEFDVNISNNDPDASTIQVDDTDREGWFDIFVFELSADDSESDIEIDTIPVTIDITNGGNGTSTIDDVIRDLELIIDGEVFDDYTISTSTATTSSVVTFDIDENYTLDADDEVDVALSVEFEGRDGNYINGQQIKASVNSDGSTPASATDIDAEGAEDIVADGSAAGEWHTLLAEGIFAYDASTKTSTSGQNDTVGTFKIFFTVDAFEDDFHFADDGSDINFTVNGPATSTTSFALNDLSDANEDDVEPGHYTVYEGESEDFEFSVTVDPSATGQFNVQLDSLDYGTTGATSSTYTFTPSSDYKTSNETIQN